MILTQRLDAAIKRAAQLHRNQVRKDIARTPYITHLVAVATLVASATDDEDTIVAGLMHDSLEDVPGYTYDSLVDDCGERVAEIVSHVTEPLDANKSEDEQLPWLTRKEAYLNVLKEGGEAAALVSLADKIHNTESYIDDFHNEGEAYKERFGSSLQNRVWFHDEVFKHVSSMLGDEHHLVKRFKTSMDIFRSLSV
jgi:(p)ppGpp synthase/HD superfamily hydrolase